MKQNGLRMASKIDANFERPFFEKTLFFFWKSNDFEGSGDRSWEQTSIKHRSKIEAQDGWPLSIDFWWILMGLGRQVGTQDRIKIDLKRPPKRDSKKYASWIAFFSHLKLPLHVLSFFFRFFGDLGRILGGLGYDFGTIFRRFFALSWKMTIL